MRIFRWRRSVLVVLILGGLGFAAAQIKIATGDASGTSFDGPTPTHAPKSTFRIATFNIDGGQGTDDVVDLNRTAKCLLPIDFAGLEEVHGFLFQTPKNQAIVLADKLKLPFIFAPSERRIFYENFGNAVLSDLPVESWKRVALPTKFFAAKRNYVETVVRFQKTPIHIFTTHTDWKDGGDEQLKIVTDAFLAAPSPAILLGDLNAPASSSRIQDLQATAGVEDSITKFRGREPGRVDWIFLRGMTTVDAWPVELRASDHPLYWAEVKLLKIETAQAPQKGI